MRCSRCQMENREGRKFCSSCGVALARACKCGYVNDPSDRFCGGCGRPLEREAEVAVDRIDDRRPASRRHHVLRSRRLHAAVVDA